MFKQEIRDSLAVNLAIAFARHESLAPSAIVERVEHVIKFLEKAETEARNWREYQGIVNTIELLKQVESTEDWHSTIAALSPLLPLLQGSGNFPTTKLSLKLGRITQERKLESLRKVDLQEIMHLLEKASDELEDLHGYEDKDQPIQ